MLLLIRSSFGTYNIIKIFQKNKRLPEKIQKTFSNVRKSLVVLFGKVLQK